MEDLVEHPMFATKGKNNCSSQPIWHIRVLFSTGTAGDSVPEFTGISGGPVVDSNGYVIGIHIAYTTDNPRAFLAVAFDSDLYKALKAYE